MAECSRHSLADPTVENHFEEMAESNFKLLKRIVDDRQFGAVLVDRLCERFWQVMREGEDELGRREAGLSNEPG